MTSFNILNKVPHVGCFLLLRYPNIKSGAHVVCCWRFGLQSHVMQWRTVVRRGKLLYVEAVIDLRTGELLVMQWDCITLYLMIFTMHIISPLCPGRWSEHFIWSVANRTAGNFALTLKHRFLFSLMGWSKAPLFRWMDLWAKLPNVAKPKTAKVSWYLTDTSVTSDG